MTGRISFQKLFDKTALSCIALLLFATEAFCQYTIPSFSIGDRPIPPSGNDIIIPFEGTTLKQLSTVPALEFGQVLLRRKFGASEYGLYIGKMNEKAYSQLSAFRPPQSMNINNILNLKFYQQETRNNDLDIQNLYFDNDFIYAENTAKLFYRDTGWQSISMLESKPWLLQVNTVPSGADIYLDGKLCGRTPFSSNALFAPTVLLKISKDNYYSIDALVESKAGQVIVRFDTLKEQVNITGIGKAEQFSAEKSQSVDDIKAIIGKLGALLNQTRLENSDALKKFDENYPVLSPRSPFEKTAEFEKRKQTYENEKSTMRNEIESNGEKNVTTIQANIASAGKYRVELEKRVYTYSLPAPSLNTSTYDPDNERWNVKFQVNQAPFAFSFDGHISIPPQIAQDYYSKQKGGTVAVSYFDRSVTVEGQKYYYSIDKLTFQYGEKEYPMTGSVEIAQFLQWNEDYRREEQRLAEIKSEEERKLAEINEQKRIERKEQEQEEMRKECEEKRRSNDDRLRDILSELKKDSTFCNKMHSGDLMQCYCVALDLFGFLDIFGLIIDPQDWYFWIPKIGLTAWGTTSLCKENKSFFIAYGSNIVISIIGGIALNHKLKKKRGHVNSLKEEREELLQQNDTLQNCIRLQSVNFAVIDRSPGVSLNFEF
jgi:hypothetical protein